jgi:hypothetical protein
MQPGSCIGTYVLVLTHQQDLRSWLAEPAVDAACMHVCTDDAFDFEQCE